MRPSVMPRLPKTGPEPSQPIPSAFGDLRTKRDGGSIDTDFAVLVARFGAHGGGSLAPELCAELALEIVLNDIVEQACLITGATGAAIVLPRDGEMVCRARSGDMAPELGVRLEGGSGLSGECLRTHQTQRCEDVLLDSRADAEASRRLGVRSVIVMPLLRRAELVGVFELFSVQPSAFGGQDERNLEILAGRTLSNLDRAAEFLRQLELRQVENIESERQRELPPASDPRGEIFLDKGDNHPRRKFDLVTWILAAGVLGCAILIGAIAGRHLESRQVVRRKYPPVAAAPAAVPAPAVALHTSDAGASGTDEGGGSPASQSISKPAADPPLHDASQVAPPRAPLSPPPLSTPPPGSLQVFENGKEVFRMQPGQTHGAVMSTGQGSGIQPASSVTVLERNTLAQPPGGTEGTLLHRVEPEYPQEAREQKIQGVVVLEVQVGADGKVQDVQVLSGPPQLVGASTRAVKQWRFKPHTENGRPVEMQSRVSLNFRLPE
jgi:TonB family protein